MLAALLSVLLARPAPAQDAASGRALFDATGCRACHKIAGSGGNSGPDLTFVGFRRGAAWLDLWLTSPHRWKSDTLMPEFRLKAAERQALVSFLSSLQGQGFWHDAARTGRELFNRVGCVACHGPAGIGGHPNNNVPGGLIPALTRAAEGYTPEELVLKIGRGSRPQKADPEGPEPLVSMPAWGQVLTPGEIASLGAYLASIDSAQAGKADW